MWSGCRSKRKQARQIDKVARIGLDKVVDLLMQVIKEPNILGGLVAFVCNQFTMQHVVGVGVGIVLLVRQFGVEGLQVHEILEVLQLQEQLLCRVFRLHRSFAFGNDTLQSRH
jgi:hypothetical protein